MCNYITPEYIHAACLPWIDRMQHLLGQHFQGNSLVLFYTTFSNAYSYVPVGCITDVTGLKEALGSGDAEARFARNE